MKISYIDLFGEPGLPTTDWDGVQLLVQKRRNGITWSGGSRIPREEYKKMTNEQKESLELPIISHLNFRAPGFEDFGWEEKEKLNAIETKIINCGEWVF